MKIHTKGGLFSYAEQYLKCSCLHICKLKKAPAIEGFPLLKPIK